MWATFLLTSEGVVVECSYLFELSNQILYLFLVDCEIVSSEIKGLLLLVPQLFRITPQLG